jgi:hypothetical protein
MSSSPHKLRASSATFRRRHRILSGNIYRAGDRLLVSLTGMADQTGTTVAVMW